PDQFGQSRAGFFARKVFVVEKIVELLLKQGNAEEALRYAELAKARSLQDLLAARGAGGRATGGRGHAAPALSRVLQAWDRDVAALEYFLSSEQAWAFVVTPAGKVKAWRLEDGKGSPIASRDLVERVQRFL